MKLYDVLFQCAICNETTDHFLVVDRYRWRVGDETINGVCYRCKEEDEDTGIVTHIEEDVSLDEPEEIREHLEETWANFDLVAHLIQNRLPDKIESYTAWVIPQSRYPERDWLTMKEVAEKLGIPKSTLQTWRDRGKLFDLEIKGLIQKTGSTTLIHSGLLDQIKELKKDK